MSARSSIGVLAYGSLIGDPGPELEEATIEKRSVLTPFGVEFARTSTKRAGAPTLVPTEQGGPVNGCVLVLNIAEDEATHRLWRREINAIGTGRLYVRPKVINQNSVLIDRLEHFAALDTVLYTRIAVTVAPLTAERLAELAIESARRIKDGRDGISYLIAAKRNGIQTPLSDKYEAEVLRRCGATSLEDARRILQEV